MEPDPFLVAANFSDKRVEGKGDLSLVIAVDAKVNRIFEPRFELLFSGDMDLVHTGGNMANS